MQYLALRWFTLTYFEEDKLKLFHSLERAIKNANVNKKLCWHKQTENFLKREFANILTQNTNCRLNRFQKFQTNLQKLMKGNNLTAQNFLSDIDFIHKCDKIIYRKSHAVKLLPKITSLP